MNSSIAPESLDGPDEIVETVVALVNSGAVRLCGNFRGRTFEPGTLEAR